MNINLWNDEKDNRLKISITGYRTLLIFKALLEKSHTIDELVEIVKENEVVGKSASKDTIRLDINTLKLAGCVITRPSKANNYKYELVSHPFSLYLSDEEFEYFIKLREKFAKEISVKEVFVLNDFYKKIFSLVSDEEQKEFADNSEPLKTTDRKIFSQLSNPKIINKKIQITYKSPKYGEETFYVIPKKIIYENEKVYLWCYNCKYAGIGILNLDRIVKINIIDLKEKVETEQQYTVVYELFMNEIENFELQDYETIVEQSKDKIKIKAVVNNEFLFMQRILQFGTSFKIILPEFFKEKVINKIRLIQKGYEE